MMCPILRAAAMGGNGQISRSPRQLSGMATRGTAPCQAFTTGIWTGCISFG